MKCYILITCCNIFGLLANQVCRLLNEFVQNVALQNVSNKNVELGGKNGFKLSYNGIAHWIRKQISVDSGFHIAMARQMNVFLCTMELLPMEMKQLFGSAYSLLFQVHANLRMPVRKLHIAEYQDTIDTLLACMKSICRPSSKTECHSMKHHYPYHWGDTRIDLGCPANEKSLERKLSESQKRHYAFTNKKDNCDGQIVHPHVLIVSRAI
jgi:hypothetical protein